MQTTESWQMGTCSDTIGFETGKCRVGHIEIRVMNVDWIGCLLDGIHWLQSTRRRRGGSDNMVTFFQMMQHRRMLGVEDKARVAYISTRTVSPGRSPLADIADRVIPSWSDGHACIDLHTGKDLTTSRESDNSSEE